MRIVAKLVLAVMASMYASVGEAGVLTFFGPEVEAPAPAPGSLFSIYAADAPEAAPIAATTIGEPVELPAGRYLYGIGSHHWRSPPFDAPTTGGVEIGLGVILLEAPPKAEARFGLFDGATQRLLTPLVPGIPAYAPAGTYVLRQDLSEAEIETNVTAGAITRVPLGAIALSREAKVIGGVSYLAATDTGRIVAALAPAGAPTAIPPGNYLIGLTPGVTPTAFAVAAGETATLSARRLRWVDQTPDGAAIMLADPEGTVRATVTPGRPRTLVFFGLTALTALQADTILGAITLADDAPTPLWRLTNGGVANFSGLPLRFGASGPAIVRRGGQLLVVAAAPEAAYLRFEIRQGQRVIDLGQQRGQFNRATTLLVPDDLAPDQPFTVVALGPAGSSIRGETTPISVHRPLTAGVDDLTIVQANHTAITLTWTPPAEADALGVDVFRGAAERPLNRNQPIVAGRFDDIGLSAGRAYRYRVCPIDALGLYGPCAEVDGKTAPP